MYLNPKPLIMYFWLISIFILHYVHMLHPSKLYLENKESKTPRLDRFGFFWSESLIDISEQVRIKRLE